MATWKKIVVSGSNVSQLNNDAGYLTTGTLTVPNSFSTASIGGTALIANTTTSSLNFASSSGQGLTITGDAGTDTLTFGLAAVPNTSLANSAITIAGTSTSLGGSITAATILSGTGVFSGSAQITGLTNANLSGTAGITNANLANSSITVGSTNIALGATSTTLAGLTSVTSTGFTGSLFGTSSWANNATNSTTATNANNVAVTDTTTGTGPYYVMFADGTTGNRAVRVDSVALTFNATTNTLTVTSSFATTASFASTAPYSGLTGVPAGIVSGSSQVAALLPAGTVSGSSQISFGGITGVPAGLVSGSSQITYSGISGIPTGIVSASVLSSPAQGEARLTINGVAQSIIDLGLQTTDNPSFAGVTAGNVTVGVSTDNTITTTTGDLIINSAGGTVTVPGNLTVSSNLTVIGTASFQQTTNLEVADRFVLLASGSNTTGDGGLVVQQATQNVGELFGWDSGVSRWAVTGSFTANQGAFTPDAFMAAVTTLSSANPNTSGPAARYNANGNIYVSSGDESIWIYS